MKKGREMKNENQNEKFNKRRRRKYIADIAVKIRLFVSLWRPSFCFQKLSRIIGGFVHQIINKKVNIKRDQ